MTESPGYSPPPCLILSRLTSRTWVVCRFSQEVTRCDGSRQFRRAMGLNLTRDCQVAFSAPPCSQPPLLKSRPTITKKLVSAVSQFGLERTHWFKICSRTTGGEQKLPGATAIRQLEALATWTARQPLSPLLPAVASHTVQTNLRNMSCVYLLFPRKSLAVSVMVHVNLG